MNIQKIEKKILEQVLPKNDWKTTGEYAFEILRYKKNDKIVRVLRWRYDSFIVDVSTSKGGWHEIGDYKTESQAIKVAKEYMRTH